MTNQFQSKVTWRRLTALAVLCCAAVVRCIRGGNLLPKSLSAVENNVIDLDEMQYEAQLNRYLLSTLDEVHLLDGFDTPPSEGGEPIEDDTSSSSPIGTKHEQSPFLESLSSYTLEDAINEAKVFRLTFAIMVYDPTTDTFLAYYSKNHLWRSSFIKLSNGMRHLAFMLRLQFPGRFKHGSKEFAVAISSGDYPHVHLNKIPHVGGKAPVLHFGSIFRDERLYPNMVAMPMPGLHIDCFTEWAHHKYVCMALRPLTGTPSPDGELAFGEELGLEWDNLEPQVVWRGTDFNYLPLLVQPRQQQASDLSLDRTIEELTSLEDPQEGKMNATVQVLRDVYDILTPRWKGVVLTAEAELAAKDGELPWADIKFSQHLLNGVVTPTVGSAKYQQFEEVGVAVGKYMGPAEQSKYKYYIDIAGGGGTTWTGTSSKLPMPGLLFHHVTPTKDYYHDRLQPWTHYVPVSPDLHDLKDKFDWAESNPREAKRIADRSTEFMRYLGTSEGFKQLYEEEFLKPLELIIGAFMPISKSNPGKTWEDILVGSDMVRVLECKGLSYRTRFACTDVGGEVVERWRKEGKYHE
mmetsp:Transcript_5385/g.11744  ORF Transcript_5385/g.11744 Transcript_5385/m.11744 type:complete len:577 (+) Transcript_5385:304-2034(+)